MSVFERQTPRLKQHLGFFPKTKQKYVTQEVIENIVGKGENARYQHLFSFSHNVIERLFLQG